MKKKYWSPSRKSKGLFLILRRWYKVERLTDKKEDFIERINHHFQGGSNDAVFTSGRQTKYDELVNQYEDAKAERDKLEKEIVRKR